MALWTINLDSDLLERVNRIAGPDAEKWAESVIREAAYKSSERVDWNAVGWEPDSLVAGAVACCGFVAIGAFSWGVLFGFSLLDIYPVIRAFFALLLDLVAKGRAVWLM